MGFLDGLLGGGGSGGMSDPVRGTAQVVSASSYNGRGVMQSCTMHLVVQAEGVPATPVEFSGLVHRKRWPRPGMALPVTVDRANPQKVNIEWDEVERSDDRARHSAEDMAAAMRGEGGAGATGMPIAGLGGAQIVNLSGQDLSQLPEEKKQKLRMLGIDPDQLAAQQGAAPVPPSPAPGDQMDDRLEQLERLAKLRDQGVLTDAEFEEQKKQILE